MSLNDGHLLVTRGQERGVRRMGYIRLDKRDEGFMGNSKIGKMSRDFPPRDDFRLYLCLSIWVLIRDVKK